REDAVDGLGDAEFDQEADEQGDIINPLVGQIQGGVVADGLRRFGGAMKGACVGRVPGDNHGCSPTKPEWKAGLYRSGRPERKIQAKEREHGNVREVGLRYNWTSSIHLIRGRGVFRLVFSYGLYQHFTWVDLTRTAGPRPPRCWQSL